VVGQPTREQPDTQIAEAVKAMLEGAPRTDAGGPR
jgi:hypothetical protein